jgi:hypothetical protein
MRHLIKTHDGRLHILGGAPASQSNTQTATVSLVTNETDELLALGYKSGDNPGWYYLAAEMLRANRDTDRNRCVVREMPLLSGRRLETQEQLEGLTVFRSIHWRGMHVQPMYVLDQETIHGSIGHADLPVKRKMDDLLQRQQPLPHGIAREVREEWATFAHDVLEPLGFAVMTSYGDYHAAGPMKIEECELVVGDIPEEYFELLRQANEER